jgi:hypothetical protein
MGGVDVVAAQRHPKQRFVLRQQPRGIPRKQESVRRGAQFVRVGNGEEFDIGQAKIAQRIAGSPPRMAPSGHRPQLLPGKDFNRRFRLIHKLYCVVPLQGCHDLSRDCACSGACGKR